MTTDQILIVNKLRKILIVNKLRIMIKGGQDRTGRYPKWDGEGAMQDQLFPGLRPSAIEVDFYLSKMEFANWFIFTISFFVGQNDLMLPKEDVLQYMNPYNYSVSEEHLLEVKVQSRS